MSTKQLVVIVAAVALASAGVGVVVTSQFSTKEVRVSLDLGGEPIDLGKMTGNLEGARISANENAAIATLRSIASAQAQVQAAVAIDTDGDAGGEYAYFAELAGNAPLRTSGADGQPALGTAPLNPPYLASAFGDVRSGPGGGVVERCGYVFQIFLPGASEANGACSGVAESVGGGSAASGPFPDPAASEIIWCAYAWPLQAGTTGARVFFINQDGDLLETANKGGEYDGYERGPVFDAAFSADSPGDMAAASGSFGAGANDGWEWSPL